MSSQKIHAGYDERVYAGVLGKIIGVYLGRPFAKGVELSATASGKTLFKIVDGSKPLTSGAIALIVEEGRLDAKQVSVHPVNQ